MARSRHSPGRRCASCPGPTAPQKRRRPWRGVSARPRREKETPPLAAPRASLNLASAFSLLSGFLSGCHRLRGPLGGGLASTAPAARFANSAPGQPRASPGCGTPSLSFPRLRHVQARAQRNNLCPQRLARRIATRGRAAAATRGRSGASLTACDAAATCTRVWAALAEVRRQGRGSGCKHAIRFCSAASTQQSDFSGQR